jgi:hypothetical protein
MFNQRTSVGRVEHVQLADDRAADNPAQEHAMNPTVITYLVYIAASVALTIWVATTLTRSGAIFLVDVFHGEEKVAAATNRLLVVGFYLVNLGFVSLMLRVSEPVTSAQHAIEALASKLGAVALLLGALHLVNVLVLSRVRRHRFAPTQPQSPYDPSWQHRGPSTPPAYGDPSFPAPDAAQRRSVATRRYGVAKGRGAEAAR